MFKKKKDKSAKKRKKNSFFIESTEKKAYPLKYAVDVPIDHDLIPAPWSNYIRINALDDGTGFYRKTSNVVKNFSLYVEFVLEPNLANPLGNEASKVRIVIVYDKSPRGYSAAPPSYSEIFAAVDENGVSTSDVWSPISWVAKDRFWIIKNWFFRLPAVGILGAPVAVEGPAQWYPGMDSTIVREWVNLGGIETIFNDKGTGTFEEIEQGSIFMCWMINDVVFPEHAFKIKGNIRLKFASL